MKERKKGEKNLKKVKKVRKKNNKFFEFCFSQTTYNLIMVSHPEWVGPVFVRIETDTPLGLRFQGANVHFFQMSES